MTARDVPASSGARDDVRYVDADPLIPGHLPAGHVHHRGSDRCLRNDTGEACLSGEALRARVVELEAEVEYERRARLRAEATLGAYDPEGYGPWLVAARREVDRLHRQVGEQTVRARDALAERDAARQQVANVRALLPSHYTGCRCVGCEIRAALDGPAAPPQEPHPTPEADEECRCPSDRVHACLNARCPTARQQDEEAQG